MTNFELVKLQQKLCHTMKIVADMQKEYRKETGAYYILGQGIDKLLTCDTCKHATNNGKLICCCEESPYWDQVVSDGCVEYEEI